MRKQDGDAKYANVPHRPNHFPQSLPTGPSSIGPTGLTSNHHQTANFRRLYIGHRLAKFDRCTIGGQ